MHTRMRGTAGCTQHLGGEQGEDAGAAAHVQDNLALEQEGVAQDGLLVAARAHPVLQHLLMDACAAHGGCKAVHKRLVSLPAAHAWGTSASSGH